MGLVEIEHRSDGDDILWLWYVWYIRIAVLHFTKSSNVKMPSYVKSKKRARMHHDIIVAYVYNVSKMHVANTVLNCFIIYDEKLYCLK